MSLDVFIKKKKMRESIDFFQRNESILNLTERSIFRLAFLSHLEVLNFNSGISTMLEYNLTRDHSNFRP